MKQSLDSQRRAVGKAMNAAKAANIGSRSITHVKNSNAGGDRKANKFEAAVRSSIEANGADVKALTEEEMNNLRRQVHNHILKNQYSYWAGMYVKRVPAGGEPRSFGASGGRPSAEEVILANRANT